jgi:hypothetical protein
LQRHARAPPPHAAEIDNELTHPAANRVRVREAEREPGAGGAAGAPAVRDMRQRAAAGRGAGPRHRRRRRQGGRLPEARQRHCQLLRPA